MMTSMLKTALGLGTAMLALAGAAQAEPIAIVNAEIHLAGPSESPRTIANGSIYIDEGRILAVGANVTPPDGDFRVIDADGQPVTPGLFAVLSAVGIEEIGLNAEANERRAGGDFPLSAALNAEDGLNTQSAFIKIGAAAGVTRAYVTPDPGSKLFGGCGIVIALDAGPDPVMESCLAQTVAMGQGGASRSGDTKTGAFAMLRYYLDEALRYGAAPEDYRFMPPASNLTLADLAALVPFARGEKPMLVDVESAPDIRRLIALKQDYGLDLVLYSAREAWIVAQELALADIPVIINPLDNLPASFEAMGATMENAARLQAQGVRVAFYDNDMGYTHNLEALKQLAGNAVANGMAYEDALAAITLNPAYIWGLEDELGTIQAGKTADLVVWSGDPLELSSRPVAVLIEGEEISLETRQTMLAKRYRDLTRKDLPTSYQGD